MVKIIYVEANSIEHEVDVPEGWTVMQGAVANGVPGIEAECGGSCSCGTCHVYVEEADLARLPDLSENEEAMLDMAAAEVKPTSRLACQLPATAALGGLVVRMPKSQG
ncbi:MAG: 2Fe-2S iron-sulfur cluster-binding protein [Pseudolabrys sp.]|jgi:2Fe-2S ferredoxin